MHIAQYRAFPSAIRRSDAGGTFNYKLALFFPQFLSIKLIQSHLIMKFSTLALLTSTAIAAETVDLKIVSDNSELSGKGIQGLHEGAGISYFGVSDQLGEEFSYDADKKLLTQEQGSFTANVGASGNFFAVGPAVEPSQVTFDGEGYLSIDKQLYACKQLNDPYRYFADSYGVVVGDAPNDSCVKIALQKVGGESEASSAEASAAPTSAHAGWNNTVTEHITVTGYTTYCPESTVLTITTCENKACGPKTITVSEAQTVTVTEECIVPKTSTTPVVAPTTTEPAPETTKPASSKSEVTSAPKPTTPTTVAHVSRSSETASSAVVSSYEGAGVKNAAGAVLGFAGAAALLI